MPALKNIRHEKFVREYIKTGVGAEAYRRVYPGANPYTTARVCAAQLLTRPSVKRRKVELQEQLMKRSDITVEKILSDYQYALDMAKAQEKSGEITSAATAQAKLVGLLIDRREQGTVGDFEAMNSIQEVLDLVANESGKGVADAIAKAMGLDVVEIPDPPSDAVN
jgi:phage terminase small subunit